MVTLSGRAPGRTRRIRVPIGAEPPPDHSEQPDFYFLGCSSVCPPVDPAWHSSGYDVYFFPIKINKYYVVPYRTHSNRKSINYVLGTMVPYHF
jgi:hypothetical protein